MRQVAFLLLLSTAAACSAASAASDAGWRETVRQFTAQHFKHPAWGYSHSVRDYELAKTLAADDHVALDDDVLFAAAYLHDMAAFAPWDREQEGIDHADEGARVMETVLKSTDFPPAKIEAVRSAIRKVWCHPLAASDYRRCAASWRTFSRISGARPTDIAPCS